METLMAQTTGDMHVGLQRLATAATHSVCVLYVCVSVCVGIRRIDPERIGIVG